MKISKSMIIFFSIFFVLLVVVFFMMQQTSFGQNPQKERLIKIELSPNYKNGTFQNISATPVMAEKGVFMKMMKMMVFTKHPNTEPKTPVKIFNSDLKTDSKGKTQIVWFGHSSYLIKIDGFSILVDPVLSNRASPFTFAGVKNFDGTNAFKASDFPNLDVVLLTHDHYDHLDYRTIMNVNAQTDKFVMPLGVGEHLERWDIQPSKINELDWWDSIQVTPEIKIIATPARHFSGRGFARNKTLWASFVIITPTHRIYVGGDGGYDKHFRQIGEKYGPFDIAMLECGQYNFMWRYIHAMPEQTAQAAVDLNTRLLLPVHWGRFKLSVHPWTEPIERVLAKAAELNVPVTTPMIGEPITLDSIAPTTKWWTNQQ